MAAKPKGKTGHQEAYDSMMLKATLIKDRVRAVFHEHANGFYLHGRPGTSKTFLVRSTLDNLVAHYEVSQGHLTPIGLFDLIEENKDRIIVLDDVSSIFNQPIALQILLSALGNPHDDSGVRIVTYKTAKGTRKIPFTGGIICLSNLSLSGHHNEVLGALRDRVHVMDYDPTDAEIIALIYHIAAEGKDDIKPIDATAVANYLLATCEQKNLRPSVRLYVDKALGDFRLWREKKCESHWRDLVSSSVEQSIIEHQHEMRDLSRAELMDAEKRIALSVYLSVEGTKERVAAWKSKTGKSQPAFYRHIKKLKSEGSIP